MYKMFTNKRGMPPGYIRKFWLIMRLTTVILIATFMQVSAAGFAQKITMSKRNVPLEEVIKDLRKLSGFDFIATESLLNRAAPVTIEVKNVEFEKVLDRIFEEQKIEYVIEGRTVTLKRKEKSYLETVIDRFQAIDVRGKVVDSLGNGLAGATVSVKGTNKSTQTTQNGEFYLKGVEESAVLVTSYLGYLTKEQLLSTEYNFVRLIESTSKLDEVQIQAYGTTTRRLSTGNISTVKAKDIERNVVSDPMLALKGMVPGLTITQTSGIPGANININIRGINSFNNGTEPLVIVDGIPFDGNPSNNLGFIGGGRGSAVSPFSFINPADIESIDVLKDADATAIYGSRGANGVILITTKRGKSGAAKIEVKLQHGIGEVAKHRNLLNTQEYLVMRKEAFANDGVEPSADPLESRPGFVYAPDLTIWDQNAYTDWQKEFLGKSSYSNFQGNISGGTNNSNFLISGNYNRETTVFPGNSNYQTGKIRFNLNNTSANGKFRSNLGGGFTSDKSFMPGQDFIRYFDLPPNAPNAFNQDGTLNWAIDPINGSSTWPDGFNPYSKMLNEAAENKNNSLVGNIELGYAVFPNLDISVNANVNQVWSNSFFQNLISGIEPRFRSLSSARAMYSNSKNFSWQLEPLLSFKKKSSFGDFGLTAGATILSRLFEIDRLVIAAIKDDAFIRNPASGIAGAAAAQTNEYRYSAYFGRLTYVYDNKYLLNATIRTDGSSRFGPNKQYNVFGALGAGYVFSEEKFIKEKLPVLSFGKLRGSWGVSGNDQIGDYRYLDTYTFLESQGGASYQGIIPLSITAQFNPNYGWERTIKKEYGLELGFFKDRILLSGSWYVNTSDNQLLMSELPFYVGVPSVLNNLAANLENVGKEYTLTSRNWVSKNFDWSTSFNISFQKNRALTYDNSIAGLIVEGYLERLAKAGKSISSIELFSTVGLNPETGTYDFLDQNGNPGTAFFAWRNALVDPTPRFYGGLLNSFRFKGFQLDISLQFVRQTGKNTTYRDDDPRYIPGGMRNQDRIVLARWQKAGDISAIRKFTQNWMDELAIMDYARYLNSDANYSDASFIRCNNLSLSWELPKTTLKKIGVVNCNLFLQAQNVFTITPYKGWDPETKSVTSIPALRVLTTGIQLSF